MEPSPISPEELLRTYDTIILWVTWIFAVSAWLATLGYLVFLWLECLPPLRVERRVGRGRPVCLPLPEQQLGCEANGRVGPIHGSTVAHRPERKSKDESPLLNWRPALYRVGRIFMTSTGRHLVSLLIEEDSDPAKTPKPASDHC